MNLQEYQKLWTIQENQTIRALTARCCESTSLKNVLAAEVDAWREVLIRLQNMSNRVREALAWTKVPLDINHENVNLLIDAHQDIPNCLLAAIKDEAAAIIQRSDELCGHREETRKRQMEGNKIRDQIEEAWSDKKQGLDLDCHALGLTVESRYPTLKTNAEARNLSVDYNPEGDSCHRINETVKRSQELRDEMLKYLGNADRGLDFTAANIQAAYDRVRAATIRGRKAALEWRDRNIARLAAARSEKEHMKAEYLGLHNAIHDNNRPLMLAETRMDVRAMKPSADQETDESNRMLNNQLHTVQKLYQDNIGPMKNLKRSIQDRLDEEIDLLRSIELVNNKLLNAYERCISRGQYYPTSKQLLGCE
ncbi:hypothetical protein BV898_09971 [Hypsibius exemplaris]|uniref:Tektin n=1 Tax=Hypsibius exemplaris TaxID=2072580 RepID=A0A1W0WKY4_HYPEX|nr:hypothetical protein BV898_09971 [Hypsibius exemplaris]